MTGTTRVRLLTWAFAAYCVLSLVSMATMSIGAALLGAALFAFHPEGALGFVADVRAGARRHRGYLLAALALTLACALSLAVATFWPLTYGGKQAEIHFLKDMAKAWYLFWPLLMLPALKRIGEEGRAQALRAWLIAFGALSVLGVFQHFYGWPRKQMIPGNEPFYHATLFLGHHLSVASVFIFPMFAALDLGARQRRPALFALAALGAVTLFLGWSRTLWLALPLGLLAWGIWALPRRWAVASVFSILIAAGIALQLPPVQKRVNDGIGIGERRQLWEMNYEFLKARPLTGTGWHKNLEYSSYWLEELRKGQPYLFAGHAHNNLLEMLGSTGLLGTLAWLAYCGLGIALALKAAKRRAGFARGLACAWLVFHVNGLTQVNFWESKVLHQQMLMLAWTLWWNETT